MMSDKKPDNVVFNEVTGEYDASKKPYPTSVGAPSFELEKKDTTLEVKAENYFKSRLNELKDEYKKLVEEYNWTKLVYEAEYSFEPIVGQIYHLYERKNKSIFLSLVAPDEWKQKYIGSFKQLNNGKWENIEL